MNVVVLGNICIDKNRVEGKEYENAGGPAVFISSFFKKQKNVNFATIASFGTDFLPYKSGLNLFPSKPNLSKTLIYENIVKSGKRAQKCHFYKENTLPEINQDLEDLIKNADILFVAPLIPYFSSDYVKKIISLTSNNCLKILIPQGYFRDFDYNDNVIFREFKEAGEILPFVDFVILSNEDYPNIEKESLVWTKNFKATFIVTTNKKGAEIIKDEEKILIPTNPIPDENIVDVIGAGDIFSASFAYNYFKSKKLFESVKLANAAAREKLLSI